jgi:hypothetical protein
MLIVSLRPKAAGVHSQTSEKQAGDGERFPAPAYLSGKGLVAADKRAEQPSAGSLDGGTFNRRHSEDSSYSDPTLL